MTSNMYESRGEQGASGTIALVVIIVLLILGGFLLFNYAAPFMRDADVNNVAPTQEENRDDDAGININVDLPDRSNGGTTSTTSQNNNSTSTR